MEACVRVTDGALPWRSWTWYLDSGFGEVGSATNNLLEIASTLGNVGADLIVRACATPSIWPIFELEAVTLALRWLTWF